MRTVLVLLVAVLFVSEAEAQSCASLRNQLAAAQSSGGGAQAAHLRGRHRAFGCHRVSGYGRHRACTGIEAEMRRLRGGGQVAALQRRVAAACAPRRIEPREATREPARRRATTMIGGRVVHGATADSYLDRSAGRRRGGNFFSRIFGEAEREPVQTARIDPNVERLDLNEPRSRRSRGEAKAIRATRSAERPKGYTREGSQRTVCVRLCDGFYFPINSRSHSDNFYDELAMCVGRCPSADVSLYTHHASNPVESMRSTMTGESYVDLPTAFAYRKRALPNCACQPQSLAVDTTAEAALARLGKTGERQVASAEPSFVPSPGAASWTPLSAVYDETGKPLDPLRTDRTSRPDRPTAGPLPARPLSRPSGVDLALADADEVREVGPQFFSDVTLGEGPPPPADRSLGTTTAVTVVPLAASARSVPDDAPAAAASTTLRQEAVVPIWFSTDG
ncbi:DUF2865 domain-containing protein [Acuticoccus sp.]|uniref:DUF2865 domain-containing protein n=1 Tax=Acuticoccus sp. TaxID=1904378 RepID=UPI003B524F4A